MDDLEDKGDIYKVTVYRNTRQECLSYTTPKEKKALETYFDVRRRDGEVINEKSPVMRNSTIGKVDYQSNIPDMRLGQHYRVF